VYFVAIPCLEQLIMHVTFYSCSH